MLMSHLRINFKKRQQIKLNRLYRVCFYHITRYLEFVNKVNVTTQCTENLLIG